MTGLALVPLFLALTRLLLRGALRSIALVGRVSMILGLEMLGLVWTTFMILSHEFSEFESRERLSTIYSAEDRSGIQKTNSPLP